MSSRRQMLEFLSLSRLPAEFQEVEYIESSGTQYIDTGIISSTEIRTHIVLKTKTLDSNYNRLFGTRGQWGSQYGVRSRNNTQSSFYGELPSTVELSVITTTLMEANTIYNIDFNNNYHFYINGNDEGTFQSVSQLTGSQTIWLFGMNANSLSSYLLYSCQIYDNGTLVRNFVPCYRKVDNVAGLYDLVNGLFYTNAGTGTFIVGGNV